jgi:hypothetical protein
MLILPFETQPANVIFDIFNIFGVFCNRIGIVKSQIGITRKPLGQSEIQANAGMHAQYADNHLVRVESVL